MQTNSTVVALALMLMAAASSPVCAENTAVMRGRGMLRATYARLFLLKKRNDAEALLRFFQHDTISTFVAIDETGKQHSREQQLQVMEDVAAGRATSVVPNKSAWHIDRIIMPTSDSAIVVTTRQDVANEMDTAGHYGRAGKVYRIVRLTPERDTWVIFKNGPASGWKWEKAESGHPQTLVDGKLVDD